MWTLSDLLAVEQESQAFSFIFKHPVKWLTGARLWISCCSLYTAWNRSVFSAELLQTPKSRGPRAGFGLADTGTRTWASARSAARWRRWDEGTESIMGGSGMQRGGSERSWNASAHVVDVNCSRGVGLDRESTVARRVCVCVLTGGLIPHRSH